MTPSPTVTSVHQLYKEPSSLSFHVSVGVWIGCCCFVCFLSLLSASLRRGASRLHNAFPWKLISVRQDVLEYLFIIPPLKATWGIFSVMPSTTCHFPHSRIFLLSFTRSLSLCSLRLIVSMSGGNSWFLLPSFSVCVSVSAGLVLFPHC